MYGCLIIVLYTTNILPISISFICIITRLFSIYLLIVLKLKFYYLLKGTSFNMSELNLNFGRPTVLYCG